MGFYNVLLKILARLEPGKDFYVLCYFFIYMSTGRWSLYPLSHSPFA